MRRKQMLVAAAAAMFGAMAMAQAPRQSRAPAKLGSSVAVQPDFARISGTFTVVSTGQITNPAAMNSPLLNNLQQQKRAADIESGQIMSAPGGAASSGTPSVSGMGRPGIAPTAKPPLVGGPPKPAAGIAQMPAMICLPGAPGIRSVNQKKTGVVFTPDPHYNLYTITGCNFGSSPGKIYLQGGANAFSAHNGKLALIPVDPARAWNDRAIVAKLDPSITGEMDQDNISLVVETSAGRAQADGFSFYALRGPGFSLKQIPRKMVCTVLLNGDLVSACDAGVVYSEAAFTSPCGLWGLSGCTAAVFRQSPVETPEHPFHDQYSLKLKPGFVLYAAMVQVASTDTSHSVYNPYAVKFSGNTVVVQTQPMCYANSSAHTCPSPYSGPYYSLYGVTLYVSGPAGIMNPLADSQ